MTWKAPSEDFARVLLSQNPWVETDRPPVVPPFRRSLESHLLGELLEPSLRRFELVLGPRRVGKTTLMYQLVADLIAKGISKYRVWWMRLDHPILVDQPLDRWVKLLIGLTKDNISDPVTAETPIYVFLDEILYAKNWSAWLKTFYDDNWPVRVVATGSATAALRKEHRESGVGRWRQWYLSPMLFQDFLRIQGVDCEPTEDARSFLEHWKQPRCTLNESELNDALRQYVMVGGFPELAKDAGISPSFSSILRSQEVLREDAITRAIYKDLTQAYDIQDPMALEKLLYVLAGQICGLLRIDNLASIAGISQPTVETYMKYLEEANLIFTVKNYASSEEAVQRRGRKVYFTDSALRNAALLRGVVPLEEPAELGALYENTVGAHLDAFARFRNHRLFHWRDRRDEVDFVVGHPSKPVAIEVTGGQQHSMRGIVRLLTKYPGLEGRGWLISPTAIAQVPSQDQGSFKPGTAPLAKWLLACGFATDAAITQVNERLSPTRYSV